MNGPKTKPTPEDILKALEVLSKECTHIHIFGKYKTRGPDISITVWKHANNLVYTSDTKYKAQTSGTKTIGQALCKAAQETEKFNNTPAPK